MNEKIHDGERVQILLLKRGLTKTEFADRMDFARSTLDRMLSNPDWPSNLLQKASKVLDCNLFRVYAESTGKEMGVVFLKGENGMEAYSLERIEDLNAKDLQRIILQLRSARNK